MLERIGERLLHDAVGAEGRRPAAGDRLAHHLELDRQPGLAHPGDELSSWPREGCGARASSSSLRRSTPSRRRISSTASRPVASMASAPGAPPAARPRARARAPWAWTTMTLTSWATTSCSSRAMRERSSATASRARSSRRARRAPRARQQGREQLAAVQRDPADEGGDEEDVGGEDVPAPARARARGRRRRAPIPSPIRTPKATSGARPRPCRPSANDATRRKRKPANGPCVPAVGEADPRPRRPGRRPRSSPPGRACGRPAGAPTRRWPRCRSRGPTSSACRRPAPPRFRRRPGRQQQDVERDPSHGSKLAPGPATRIPRTGEIVAPPRDGRRPGSSPGGPMAAAPRRPYLAAIHRPRRLP